MSKQIKMVWNEDRWLPVREDRQMPTLGTRVMGGLFVVIGSKPGYVLLAGVKP